MSERDDILRDVREVAREAGFTEPPPLVHVSGTWYRIDSLDAAWSEAEAALPEYALLRLDKVPGWPKFYGQEPCEARIEWWDGDDRRAESAFGPTPAAALRALAEKLRERAG